MRLGLGRKSAGRGRDRAAKNPHPCTGGGSRLGLPSRRVKWSKSTELFLPRWCGLPPYSGIGTNPFMLGTLINKSLADNKGLEPLFVG